MTFNGIEYKLKENNLAINQASIPLLVKYRKLQAEYLDDIDLSSSQYYDNQIERIELMISQIQELNENDIFKDEQTNKERIIELEAELKEIKEQKANNQEVQIVSKMRDEIDKYIMIELALDEVLMSKMFSKILIGDISKIDFESPDYVLFAAEVLAGFFTQSQLLKVKLKNSKTT